MVKTTGYVFKKLERKAGLIVLWNAKRVLLIKINQNELLLLVDVEIIILETS